MPDPVKIDAIGQIAIAVDELDRAVAFYRDVLGLTLLFESPPGLAFFDCDGLRLMLTTLQGSPEDHHSSVLYYRVTGIYRAFELLEAHGVRLERAPQMVAKMPEQELWMGFIRDPDGNLIGLMEEFPLSENDLEADR